MSETLGGWLFRRACGEEAPVPAPRLDHPRIDALGRVFGLDAFEKAVLGLAFTLATEPRAAAASRRILGDGARGAVDPAIALLAWPDGQWGAFLREAPLRRQGLLVDEEDRGLVLAEPVLGWLLGRPSLDRRLRCRVVEGAGRAALATSQAHAVQALLGAWESGDVCLFGSDTWTRRSVAAGAAGAAGLTLLRMSAADVPGSPEEREAFLVAWERDARLGGHALLVELDDARAPGGLLGRGRMGPGIWVSAPDAVAGLPCVAVCAPAAEERRAAWAELAGPDVTAAALDGLAGQFVLGLDAISTAAPRGSSAESLWSGARNAGRGRMDDLAQRIETRGSWDDLVLPPSARQSLQGIVAHVRHRHRVQDQWGFAARSSRGLGIVALFHGPSGTGKTLAAEVIANDLRLDLYRIDLSAVVSKYIGETEKHLRRLFDAADAGSAVLLFDEADALFGKRSEVRDSHDRYANIEVGYLLSRMEAYRGLAILTTNLKDAMDTAFQRRLRFVVGFSWPDVPQRRRLWERAFPVAVPREPLDLDRLSRLELTGANIHNVALHAAFLAADAGERVGMRHVARAARDELVRIGRPAGDMRELV